MALTTMLNWKAPPRDQRANFWLYQLPVMHSYLATLNKMIEELQILEWLRAGLTVLIPRNSDTERPKNYSTLNRQITI
jgi:hypothetical protein